MTINSEEHRIEEFRGIWAEAFGEPITPEEARTRSRELLSLYEELFSKDNSSDHKVTHLSEREQQALAFVLRTQAETGKTPSVRQVTAHLGLKSSRSGYRVLTTLGQKGYLNGK